MKPLKQRRAEDGYWPGTDFSSTSGSGCAEDHGRPLMQQPKAQEVNCSESTPAVSGRFVVVFGGRLGPFGHSPNL